MSAVKNAAPYIIKKASGPPAAGRPFPFCRHTCLLYTSIGKRYVCGGCGYEYIPELGDEDAEIAPGTLFEKLPEDWVCPECAEGKDQFIEA